MQITDQSFKGSREVMDGNEYENCKFENCTIVYRGGTIPTINNCNFQDCNWLFDDAAQRTLAFMKLLYHGMGAHGPELVESAIRIIREPTA
jgi:hypothetical protein